MAYRRRFFRTVILYDTRGFVSDTILDLGSGEPDGAFGDLWLGFSVRTSILRSREAIRVSRRLSIRLDSKSTSCRLGTEEVDFSGSRIRLDQLRGVRSRDSDQSALSFTTDAIETAAR